MLKNILENLNPPQKEAALHREGPLVIYAGAGSGKTRVICCRIANLVETGVPPSSIIAVTFTNKAAKEMKERVEHMIGHQSRSIIVSTFHSACARFLRVYAGEVGYEPGFSIYDDDEQKSLLKDVFRELSVPEKFLSVPILKKRIDSIKNLGKTPQQNWDEVRFAQKESTAKSYADYGEVEHAEIIAKCYELYQKKLKAQNAMDFNDLLLVMVQLLETRPNVLQALQNRFQYFLVDEFQDTNPIQFKFITLLAGKTRNLCIVGDDDQSIYSWRGADPTFILNFTKFYNDAKIVKLEQNYRSSDVIVRAATSVISRNVARTAKTLWTEVTNGEPIYLRPAFDGPEEANFIAQSIVTKIQDGAKYNEFAVLYRTNAQSRSIEDSLRRRLLPYIIYGSVRFYERAEIKLLLSYLRLLINPDDDVSFEKVVNTPRRGFGDKALSSLKRAALEEGTSLLKMAARYARNEIELDVGRGGSALKNITSLYSRWMASLEETRPSYMVQQMIGDINYEPYVRSQYPDDADDRWLNVIELKNALIEFELKFGTQEQEFTNDLTGFKRILCSFLEETSLIVEPTHKNVQAGDADAITLMTIHSAKGLEFDHVFLAGLEEGTLPHMNSLESPESIEEERRLMYVAMTRARRDLTLTHVKRHRFRGDLPVEPSRFIGEIPLDLIRQDAAQQQWFVPGYSQAAPVAPQNFSYRKTVDTYLKRGDSLEASELGESEMAQWRSGAQVRHKVFGVGVIQKIEKSVDGFRVEVRFPVVGTKRLIHTYLSLM